MHRVSIEVSADDQKLHAVSMDHQRIKKVALSRWIRASALALQAKQAKATADRHLIGESPVPCMGDMADDIRRRVCDLERRCQAKVFPSCYVSLHNLHREGRQLRQFRRIRGRIRQVSQTGDPTRTAPLARKSIYARRDSHHEPTRPAPVRTGIHSSTSAQASQSVASEPAYSRLRSELASRRRGASEEPEDGGTMRALRGALGHR